MPAFTLPPVLRKNGNFLSGKRDERIALLETIEVEQLVELLSTHEGRASLPFGKLSAHVFGCFELDQIDTLLGAILNDFGPSDIPQFVEAVIRAEPKDGNIPDWVFAPRVAFHLMVVVLKHGSTAQVNKMLDGCYIFLHDPFDLCRAAFDNELQPRNNFLMLVEHLKDDRRYLGSLIAASEAEPEVHEHLLKMLLTQLFDPKLVKRNGTQAKWTLRSVMEQLAALNAAASLRWLLNRKPLDKELLEPVLRWCFYIGDEEVRKESDATSNNIEAGTVILETWKAHVAKPGNPKAKKLLEAAADELLLKGWGKFDRFDDGLSELLAPLCSTKVLEEVAALMEEAISEGHVFFAGHLEVISDIARKRISGMTGTVKLKTKAL